MRALCTADHVYCLDPYSAHNECNAGHAFSSDGLVPTMTAA